MSINLSATGTWVLRIIAAVIMLQTLYFKFSAAPESVYIFSTIGLEPWGRIGIGILELISSLLILNPRTTGFGAVMGIGVMSGAIFYHITKVGLVVMNDGGQLFAYALIVFFSCVWLAIIYRDDILNLIKENF